MRRSHGRLDDFGVTGVTARREDVAPVAVRRLGAAVGRAPRPSITLLSSAPNRNAMLEMYSHSSRITAPAKAPYVAPNLPKFET